MAAGSISRKNKTAVTDRTIESHAGMSSSKNIGNVSLHMTLQTTKVDKNKCLSSRRCKRVLDATFSSGVPVSSLIYFHTHAHTCAHTHTHT